MFDLAVFKVLRVVIFKELVAFQRFSIKRNFSVTFFRSDIFHVPCWLHGSSPPNFRGDLKISDQNNWGGGDLSKKLNLGDELNLRRGAMKLNKCVTTTNMLVFWLACLSCLPVCQSVDDSGHKGNTGQLLNSRVLGVL